MVPSPVLELRVEDVELEGQLAVEQERAGLGRLDGVQDREQVRALGRGLVEEPHARERRQAQVPQLGVATFGFRFGVEFRFRVRRGGCKIFGTRAVGGMVRWWEPRGRARTTHGEDVRNLFRVCLDYAVSSLPCNRPPAVRHLHARGDREGHMSTHLSHPEERQIHVSDLRRADGSHRRNAHGHP